MNHSTNLESLHDLLLGIGVLHLAGHHGEELFVTSQLLSSSRPLQYGWWKRTREVDGSVVVSIDLVDHVLKLRLGRVLAEGTHDSTKLLGGNLAWKEVLARCILRDVAGLRPRQAGSVRMIDSQLTQGQYRDTLSGRVINATHHHHPCPVGRAVSTRLKPQTRARALSVKSRVSIKLTKREKASLNSATWSSVRESACRMRLLR